MPLGLRALVTAMVLGALVAATGCVEEPTAAPVDAGPIEPDRVDPRTYTVRIRSANCEGLGTGSGFLVDDRTIVTNRHVIEGSEQLEVETFQGQSLTVSVASQAQLADLAIVRVETPMDTEMGTSARLAPDNPDPGTAIRALGYPRGGPLKITEGEVEDYKVDPRLGNLSKVMRSEVPIQPGNSGGPVIDEDDLVVGVVYAIETSTEKSLIVPVRTLQSLLGNDEAVSPVEDACGS